MENLKTKYIYFSLFKKSTNLFEIGVNTSLALLFFLSLWLRSAFPIFAIADAGHDDGLFVKLAASIRHGDWLGPYNNLTHAKGIAYSLFLAANNATGLSAKTSEHLLYLFVALFFASMLGKVYNSKWMKLSIFSLLAFIPTAYNPLIGGRVVREGLYISLSLLLLALAIRCFVLSKSASVNEQLREKWFFLMLLGFVAGFYWITREEGIWLLPSLTIILTFWLCSQRMILRSWKTTVFYLSLPLIFALIVIGTINTINYYWYGVFRNNDFRSADFQSAYGALSRIKQDQWQRYIVFPRDARERAYRFSTAVRELQPHLEGSIGDFWLNAGCQSTNICQKFHAGWFMWALRDAVSAAGHYSSAKDAHHFYTRLSSEINNACDKHPDECLPYRKTMIPPWRGDYFLDTVVESWSVFNTLIKMGGAPVGIGTSYGHPGNIDMFIRITNGPLASSSQFEDDIRYKLAKNITKIISIIVTFGIPTAIGISFAWFILAVCCKRLDACFIIVFALSAAVGTRVILLGFLNATSIPGNNMLYLSPVVPMAIALIPTTLIGIISVIRKK